MTTPHSSPSDEHLPAEPHDGIDAADNVDARTYEAEQSPSLARSTGGEGAPPTAAPAPGEAPDTDGTGAGDPLAGVGIDEADAADAVDGDDGPEHPGVRRSS